MSTNSTELYLRDLDRQLRARFVSSATILEEVRGHLADAVGGLKRQGHLPAEAEEIAVTRFGPVNTVADAYAADHWRIPHRALAVVATALGIAIAYVDSQPTWDDTGVTAAALMLAGGLLGLAGPRHPWRWALLIGCWIPMHAVARSVSAGSFSLVLVLIFPLAGASAGMLLRRRVANTTAVTR